MKSSLITLAALGSVSAVPLTPGNDCPTDVVKMDFELTKYLGLWYEYRPSFGQPFRSSGDDCIKAEYSMRDDGLIRVLNSGQIHDDIE